MLRGRTNFIINLIKLNQMTKEVKIEKNKISEEELSKIQELNKKLYEQLVLIGQLEVDRVERANHKETAIQGHMDTLKEMNEFKVELGQKYESTKVDMASGVLS